MCNRAKIEIEDFDSLFGNELYGDTATGFFENVQNNTVYPVEEILLAQMYPFKDHPFQVRDDQAMSDLAESIREHGVLHPAIVRKDENGGYEIISGHRRHRACQKAGLQTMPARVVTMSDEEAVICMTDANFYQRESILPSEKAKAYRMKFDALKHQGKEGGITMDQIGEAAGESGKTVQRFIRLSYLSDSMLQMVDDQKVGIVCGVNFSYLDEEEQNLISEMVSQKEINITKKMSEEILASHKDKKLDKKILKDIVEKKKKVKRKLVLDDEFLNRYFGPDLPVQDILKQIERLLKGGAADE